jgi:hypothetical protein
MIKSVHQHDIQLFLFVYMYSPGLARLGAISVLDSRRLRSMLLCNCLLVLTKDALSGRIWGLFLQVQLSMEQERTQSNIPRTPSDSGSFAC